MEIFRPGLDFSLLLRDVVKFGGVFVPRAITEEFRLAMLGEIDGVEFDDYQSKPEARVREKHLAFRGQIYQHTEIPLVTALAEELGWQVRLASVPSAHNELFYPDDVNIWRYTQVDHEIAAHQDYSHDLYLVAAFTIAGYGVVEYLGDERENTKPKIWQTGPGSLMLLRSTGLCDDDRRPFHAVKAPVHGERVSVIIRHDKRNSNEDCCKKDY